MLDHFQTCLNETPTAEENTLTELTIHDTRLDFF